MEFDFASVLSGMVEARASDVHLTAGSPPVMRLRGKISPVEGFEPLSGQQTRDVAYAIPGIARFRVNCYFPRGPISAAFRFVPQEIPTLESLRLPQILQEFTRKPRGFVLVTGPTGS